MRSDARKKFYDEHREGHYPGCIREAGHGGPCEPNAFTERATEGRKRQQERAQAGAVDAEAELAEARAVIAAVAEHISRLDLVAKQVREQGDVRQVLLSDEGVSEAPTLADELWLIAYNLRAVLTDPAAALASVRAEALREAADALGHIHQADTVPAPAIYRWLRDRADRIEGDG